MVERSHSGNLGRWKETVIGYHLQERGVKNETADT